MSKDGYEQLQNTMKEWYASNNIDNYFLDGPVTENYWSEPFKIAVLNLEAYGYEECGKVPISSELIDGWMRATGGDDKTKTTRYTSVFIHTLLKALHGRTTIDTQKVKSYYYCLDELLKSMEQISYLNIRKTSNIAPSQDIAAIQRESEGIWLSFLQKQFVELAPHLVIVGGKEGCSIANEIFGLNGKLTFKGHYVANNGLKIKSVKHFSRPNYTEMAKAINDCISIVEQNP